MINASADMFNGALGHYLLRNRGMLRSALGRMLVCKYIKLNDRLIRGEWKPQSPAIGLPVSMTSWSRRSSSLAFALFSLLCQKPVRPRSITVWLSQQDYPLFKTATYLALGEFGIQFKLCKDIKVHNKWLPMIECGYSEPYVICDDDVLYPDCWLMALTSESLKDTYIGTRCHEVLFENGEIASYSRWCKEVSWTGVPSHQLFVTGVGGAIIVPERISPSFRAASHGVV
jgi:hypothetical protein